MLSYPDSNQDKQNQNLLCYHYTIGQSLLRSLVKSGAKVVQSSVKNKYFSCFWFLVGLEPTVCIDRDCSLMCNRLLFPVVWECYGTKRFATSMTCVTSSSLIAGLHGRLSSSQCIFSVTGRLRCKNSLRASCLCGGMG